MPGDLKTAPGDAVAGAVADAAPAPALRRPRTGWRRLIGPTLLAALVAAAYGNSLRCQLVLDAHTLIRDDPRLRSLSRDNLRLIWVQNYWWPTQESDLFRPLTTLSYALNYCVLGNQREPAGYHLFNLLLHYANVLLLFRLMRRHLPTWGLALAAASLYALHPLNTEVVTNIAGRADLLSALSLLAVLELRATAPRGRWSRVARRAGMVLAAAAGVLCKENAVMALPLLVWEDLCAPPAPTGPEGLLPARSAPAGLWRRLLRRLQGLNWIDYLTTLPALLLIGCVRYWVNRTTSVFGQMGADNPLVLVDFWSGRMTAVAVLGRYLALVFWPARLSCDYSYHQIPPFAWGFSPDDCVGWLSLIALLAIAGFAVRMRRRHPAVTFLLGFAALNLLPMANLLMPVGTIMGERFMYLACAGVIAAALLVARMAATALAAITARRSGAPGVTAGATVVATLAAALGWRTWLRNEDWRDETALWRNAAAACPQSFKVYKGLAGAIRNADPQSIHALDEAVTVAERGVQILDRWPLPDEHLPTGIICDLAAFHAQRADLRAGGALLPPGTEHPGRGDLEAALLLFRRAARCDRAVNEASRRRRLALGFPADQIPDVGMPRIYEGLMRVQLRLHSYTDAIATGRYLCHLDPARADSFRVLSLAHELAGADTEAAIAGLEAIVLQPEDTPAMVEGLQRIYARLSPGIGAIVFRNGGVSLNGDNRLVMDHLQQACRRLAIEFLDAKRPTDAQNHIDHAMRECGCPASLFADLSLPRGR